MPMTWPCRLKVGPPELPRLIGASICRKSSNWPAWMSRPVAEMMLVEEAAKEIVERRAAKILGHLRRGGLIGAGLLGDRDVDDGRQHLRDERRKALLRHGKVL